jgi:hypothetical protein
VLRRTEMKELEVWVNGNVPTRINLPTDNITNWKANLRLR